MSRQEDGHRCRGVDLKLRRSVCAAVVDVGLSHVVLARVDRVDRLDVLGLADCHVVRQLRVVPGLVGSDQRCVDQDLVAAFDSARLVRRAHTGRTKGSQPRLRNSL